MWYVLDVWLEFICRVYPFMGRRKARRLFLHQPCFDLSQFFCILGWANSPWSLAGFVLRLLGDRLFWVFLFSCSIDFWCCLFSLRWIVRGIWCLVLDRLRRIFVFWLLFGIRAWVGYLKIGGLSFPVVLWWVLFVFLFLCWPFFNSFCIAVGQEYNMSPFVHIVLCLYIP